MNAAQDSPQDTGARVRQLRKMAGHSQQQMADAIGCSWSLVSKIEIGTKQLSGALVQRMASLYGVSPDWIAAGQGAAPTRATVRTVYAVPSSEPMILRDRTPAWHLPEGWKGVMDEAMDAKAAAFEAGVNDFGLPVKDAFQPVLSEFERRLKEKEK